MNERRHVSIFRNGRNQAIRIPREFELQGTQAIIRREGNCLIVEPISSGRGLLDLLAGWEDLAEGLPDAVDPPVLAEEIF